MAGWLGGWVQLTKGTGDGAQQIMFAECWQDVKAFLGVTEVAIRRPPPAQETPRKVSSSSVPASPKM